MALPDSYAGIIAALKTKSASQKFYKPNFQGVIEAILDWTGGGIDIIYPPNLPPAGGNDGDIIGIPNADGDWFIYIWADGSWQPLHILTTDVLPNPPGGMPGRAGETRRPIYTPEGEELTNQQDINWYLYNNLGSQARPEMVYYGVTPPDTAPEGALFTDEDSLKQFVHQGDGTWVEITHWTGDGEADKPPAAYVDFEPASETGEEVRVYSISNPNQYGINVSTVYNNTGLYMERWEIDPEGDGNWGDALSDFTSAERTSFALGVSTSAGNTMMSGVPYVHGGSGNDPSTWLNPSWPNLKVRCKCFNDVNHDQVTVYSEPVNPYLENHKK